MSRHIKNVTVTADNVHSFPAAEEIFGHITIEAGVHLVAPKLAMVRGWVTLMAGATLTAPVLGLVDGWLTLKENATLSAIHLTEIRRDFTAAEGAVFEAEAVTSIENINLQRNAAMAFPSLIAVQGVTLAAGTSQADGSSPAGTVLTTPLLERVEKSITLREKSWFGAPALHHIGGYADIDEAATLYAPRMYA
jgi:hypothetical protein